MSSNPTMSPNTRNMIDAKRAKIEQALLVLEEAAKDTKEDVTDVLKEKFLNTKTAFKDLLSDLDLGTTARKFGDEAEDMFKNSKRVIRKTAQQVDSSVHENPWVYLGASALVGLTLGILFGRRS